MKGLAADHDMDQVSKEELELVGQGIHEPEVPDLVQVLLHDRTLFKVHEVHIFNTHDVLPLVTVGDWYAIVTPAGNQGQLIVWYNDAKTIEDVEHHSYLLATHLHMPGPVSIKAIKVLGVCEDVMVVMTPGESGDLEKMAVEYATGLLTFNLVN